MDSIASRRNHSPFKTSNSYAASRTVDNSPLRQSSTISSGISFRTAAFSSQRTAHNTRQSLSRSYDSPEGIRRLSQVSAKKASFSSYHAASPPSCASNLKQHSSASGRNQTVLDDAAWMSERLLNLQRTGFLRYPSTSKLRDPVGNQADEPLSAFRLSEVTLSEEDLLTDISCSKDFSTSKPTPVLLESNDNLGQVSQRFHEGSPPSQEIGKVYQKYMQQNDVSSKSSSNANHPHSAATLESTTSSVRGDLLLRLEALQYRAELAAKGGNGYLSSNVNGNQDNQKSKLFGSGELLCSDQNLLSLNQKWNASSHQSCMASAPASPTRSNLSIESISWPQEPGNSLDSSCWLKDIKQEATLEPSANHLNRSLSRTIRPEYYLPLSKDEEPVLEAVSIPFSSLKGEKRTDLRNGNIRRSALSVCQQKSEGRPEKSLNNHKQRSLIRKHKRVLQSSVDSSNGYGFVKARGMPANSSPKPLPGVTKRTLSMEARAPQNHVCGDNNGIAHLMGEQSKSINKFFEMETFASEVNGQTRISIDKKFECDGESSWISEENVEGFLCSRSCTLDEAEALSASNDWPSPFLDTDLNNKNLEELKPKSSGKDLFSSSQTVCLNDKVIDGSNDSMAGICKSNCCKEVHMSSQGGSTIISQTDAHLQLWKEGSLADSCSAANSFYQSGCQVSHLEGESLKENLVACCRETFSNEQLSKESHYDLGVEEQRLRRGNSSMWNAVSPKDSSWQNALSSKDLNIVIKHSIETNMTEEAENKLESTSTGQGHSAKSSFHSSIPLISDQEVLLVSDDLSPRADLLGEDQYWSTIANKSDNTKHISKMHKNFTRIMRSLSFSERGQCELKSSSKLQKSKNISESESKGFAHYWIPGTALSLTSFDLVNDGETCSMKMQQSKEQLQGIPSENGMGDKDKAFEGNGASMILLDNSCITDLNIDQCTGEPCVMAHTVLLSKKDSDANLEGSCEAQLSNKDFSQLCLNPQLDSPAEVHCNGQDMFRIEKAQGDIRSWEKDKNRVPKCVNTETDAKGCRQQSREIFFVQESLCTKTLQIEPEEIKPEVVFEKLTLSEEQIGIASSANQNEGYAVEGAIKREMASKFSCPSYPENCRGTETPSSLLSVYKNPLWRDAADTDIEKGHSSQNQEFLDHSYSDEGSFVDSDQNKIGFSKRSLGAVWDTYEGMGGFINSFPNSPSCTAKQASEANHILANSIWELESGSKELKIIGEEASKVHGSFAQPRLKCRSQIEECQQSAPIEARTINHDTLSSGPEAISWLKRNFDDGSEDCLRESGERSFASSSNSIKLINSNRKHQDAALVPNASTVNDVFLASGPKCTTWKKMVPVTEMTYETDEVRGSKRASDQLNCNGNKTEREAKIQTCGSSISIERISAFQCVDRKLQSDPLCGQHEKECIQPAHHKLGFAKADAREENHSLKDLCMHSNYGTETGEEVKQVTFIYSDSKEPQKDLQAGGASVPDVSLDLLSTWILSFFTHASKGGVKIKRKQQRQPLIQDKAQEDQAELKRIGKKVQALEAEIDKFKKENRKLQSLLKCMIRKMKQLQQGLRGRKRNGRSRGFMTCIYSVRVQRSKTKFSRKL